MFLENEKHSTPAGFREGCRSNACPAKISCRQAATRYRWDLPFKRAIDAGLSGDEYEAQVAELEAAKRAEAAAEARRVAKEAKREAQRAARAAAIAQAQAPRPSPKTKSTPESRRTHGTRSRYYSGGCRVHEDCPNFGTDNLTCPEVQQKFNREAREKYAEKVGLPANYSRRKPILHGTSPGYRILHCSAPGACPNEGTDKPTCREVHSKERRERVARLTGQESPHGHLPEHGTKARYRSTRFPCSRNRDCPNFGTDKPTCASVYSAAYKTRKKQGGAQK